MGRDDGVRESLGQPIRRQSLTVLRPYPGWEGAACSDKGQELIDYTQSVLDG